MRGRVFLLLLTLCGGIAQADAVSPNDGPTAAPAVVLPNGQNPLPPVAAHPALWKIHGRHGMVYLLGSLHLLPPNVDWRAPNIAHAIARADVFVFETALDQAMLQKVQALIADKGSLPMGQSLRAMLPTASQLDYDADLAALGMSPAAVDGKRPWLVALLMDVTQIMKDNASPNSGVDIVLMKEAAARHKEMRYLETIDQQIALIVPDDATVELQEFEVELEQARTKTDDYPRFVAAWSRGDVAKIDALMNGEFALYPGARAELLDDRNRAWVRKIETMLDEDKTFLVTVGAGHLAGPTSVPALLRAEGYRVDGP